MGFGLVIVLDTHIWLWWVNDEKSELSVYRRELVGYADVVAVSAISCFEVAWLERHGRIDLPLPREVWFEKALQGSGIILLPITSAIASLAVDLPEHHKDPQDRMIIATSLVHDALLMSDDRRFPLYDELADRLV